jgi:hypothetical protein
MPPAKYLTADDGKKIAANLDKLAADIATLTAGLDDLIDKVDGFPDISDADMDADLITREEATVLLRAVVSDVEALKEAAESSPAAVPATVAAQPTTSASLGLLEADVTDGNCTVRIRFSDEGTASRAINALRRKVLAQGINVNDGRGTIHCFRSISRVSFSAKLAERHPILLR